MSEQDCRQFLTDQLTLSQPGGGGQIMPTTVLQAPQNFQTLRRPCITLTYLIDVHARLSLAKFIS